MGKDEAHALSVLTHSKPRLLLSLVLLLTTVSPALLLLPVSKAFTYARMRLVTGGFYTQGEAKQKLTLVLITSTEMTDKMKMIMI